MAGFIRKVVRGVAAAFTAVVNFVRGKRAAPPPLESDEPRAVKQRMTAALERGGVHAARLEAARSVLQAELRRVVGVQAPFVRYRSSDGSWIYRALTRAIHKAPPRRLSGKLQSRLRVALRGETMVISDDARSRRGFSYPWFHEGRRGGGPHPFLRVTVARMRKRLEGIAGVKLRFDYLDLRA